MLAKIFGAMSRDRYEIWIFRVSIAILVWHTLIFSYLIFTPAPTQFQGFKIQLALSCLCTIALALFGLIWSSRIGQGDFKKFHQLKRAVVIWVAAIIGISLWTGVVAAALIFSVNAVTLYFLLSQIEAHAPGRTRAPNLG